mmetsp:Transcript_14992/g.44909  ORF Transcript_14992/g.44909 Transcript_14992/m.44909 type:complete len:438 (-) Transcript_14992:1246-2559(-)
MRPIIQHLRQRGMRVFIYLDDICVLHQDREVLRGQLGYINQLLTRLGFRVHPDKTTEPLQRFKYLGMTVDTTTMTVEPQADKMAMVRRDARRLLKRGTATPRTLASFLGKITFCLSGMRSGQHKKAPLLRLLRHQLRTSGWEAEPSALTAEVRRCLGWWIHRAHALLGRLFRPNLVPSIRILSDAGPEGWGAVVRERGQATQRLSGTWTVTEQEQHQNEKEAMALLHALPAVQPGLHNHRIHWVTDSRVLFYTVSKGHSKSKRLSPIVELLRERLSPARHLHVQHIRTEEMRRADYLSRKVVDWHGWALRQSVFDRLIRPEGPAIDLFATRTNTKLARYASRHLDPSGEDDAFNIEDWTDAYAFPPPRLLPRVLREWEERNRPHMTIVAPEWPAQPWWRPLLDAAQDRRRLPPGSVFRPDERMSPISSAWRFSAFFL